MNLIQSVIKNKNKKYVNNDTSTMLCKSTLCKKYVIFYDLHKE